MKAIIVNLLACAASGMVLATLISSCSPHGHHTQAMVTTESASPLVCRHIGKHHKHHSLHCRSEADWKAWDAWMRHRAEERK